jgi:hypothetical protein
MSVQKWVRSSLRQLAKGLAQLGHKVSPPTIARLLKQAGYALRVNHKKQEAHSQHPDRDQQFDYLHAHTQAFLELGWPVISVDTKKKELVGNFKNAGVAYAQQAEAVNVHDFPSESLGRAVPYGIYDLGHNRGSVYVGQSADTPEFAVSAIARWWREEGQQLYPQAENLLILADGGGSNGWRCRAFKQHLQVQLADKYGLRVVVGHYPPGCSKWNPIEHRLFSFISLNWAGKPLRSFETILNYIRGTTTAQGLEVRAELIEQEFAKGQSVSEAEMAQLALRPAAVLSNWNYRIEPRKLVANSA